VSENIKKYVWNWKSWFSHFEVWLRYIKIKTKQRIDNFLKTLLGGCKNLIMSITYLTIQAEITVT
jgi:hypothetical protein